MIGTSAQATTTQLRERFKPTFEKIRDRSIEADVQRRLPYEELRWLAEAGFTSLRIPREFGGSGVSIRQLFALLVDLAAANSNLTQILRHHFFQVELEIQANAHDRGAAGRAALQAIVEGELLGAAVTEPHGAVIGHIGTRVDPGASPDEFVLNGDKVYTTGALFAKRIAVVAVDSSGRGVTAIVPTDRAGVTIRDDWDGFGQRLTATGSASFRDVRVGRDEIKRGRPPAGHGAGFHQLVLLATLAGIVAAVTADTSDAVRAKERVYYSGTGQLPRHDAIVQELVGKLSSTQFTTAALVAAAAKGLQDAWSLWDAPDHDEVATAAIFRQAERQVFTAQVTGAELALWATSHALDVLGASSLASSKGLDRHWRNARAVASHNPHVFKARLIGDYLLNGTAIPVFRPGHDVGNVSAAPAA